MTEQKGGRWGTTKQIDVIKDAVAEALAEDDDDSSDITEARLPLKAVIALVLYAITQALTLAGVYYNLRADVRSLQESAASSGQDPMVQELKIRTEQLERDLVRVETQTRESPTSMDNMRRVGELNADVRELKARVGAMERMR
tara:strand:- start:104 stop:532 length:429 start_codon:yes stop_codon:yes gene_type:complete